MIAAVEKAPRKSKSVKKHLTCEDYARLTPKWSMFDKNASNLTPPPASRRSNL